MQQRRTQYKMARMKPKTFNRMHVLAELMLDKEAEGLTVDKVLSFAIDGAINRLSENINVV